MAEIVILQFLIAVVLEFDILAPWIDKQIPYRSVLAHIEYRIINISTLIPFLVQIEQLQLHMSPLPSGAKGSSRVTVHLINPQWQLAS